MCTILIVEDDFYNSEYLKEVLSMADYSMIVVEYGLKAVEIVNNQKIDLILMDIRLPDINGFEATRLIRKKNKDIKIIAQTAYATNNDQIKALEAGCNDYICKPIKHEVLLSKINDLLKTNSY